MNLVQFQIEKDLSQKQIREISKKVLFKDRYWHFLHEGVEGCLIRTYRDNKELHKWLQKRKLKYNTRPWVDPHQLVRKYQELFLQIFHSYTIWALFGKKKDIQSLLNRLVHCFFNMHGISSIEEAEEIGKLFVRELLGTANYWNWSRMQEHLNRSH